MKQYKITSADFLTPGETGDPDAVMDPVDLETLKRQAGINTTLIQKQPMVEQKPGKVLRERKYE